MFILFNLFQRSGRDTDSRTPRMAKSLGYVVPCGMCISKRFLYSVKSVMLNFLCMQA